MSSRKCRGSCASARQTRRRANFRDQDPANQRSVRAMQSTPASVGGHIRPASSKRIPSNRPDAQSTNTLPPDNEPSAPTSKTRMCFGRSPPAESTMESWRSSARRRGRLAGRSRQRRRDLSARAVNAEDVVLSKLAVRLVTLVIREDPVRRIGKPDRAVRSDNDVVGAVQPLALVVVGDDRQAAVMLGSNNASSTVFTRDQPALAIDGVAVGVVGRLTKTLTEPSHSSYRNIRCGDIQKTRCRAAGNTPGPRSSARRSRGARRARFD